MYLSKKGYELCKDVAMLGDRQDIWIPVMYQCYPQTDHIEISVRVDSESPWIPIITIYPK